MTLLGHSSRNVFFLCRNENHPTDRLRFEAADGGGLEGDRFSMTLHGANLMFDGHTFAPGQGSGIVSGEVVIRP